MRILNWNTQADKLTLGAAKLKKVRDCIARYDADIVCLTEAFPSLAPEDGNRLKSELSDWGPEKYGARKVILWSRFGWRDVDTVGSSRIPEGRFISAKTVVNGQTWTIVGMCIPYHAYRTGENWGQQRLKVWEGACRYLDALREDVLPFFSNCERIVLLGDFNLQIPPINYPCPDSEVDQKRRATFSDFQLSTAGEVAYPKLDKRFIDHIALSYDVIHDPPVFFSRIQDDGTVLSDHNGVYIDVSLEFTYPCVVT